MKKIVVGFIGIFLVVTGNLSAAPISNKTYKIVRSVQEINKAVERTLISQMHMKSVWHMRIPAGIIPENWVVLKASNPATMAVTSLRVGLDEFRGTVAAEAVAEANNRGDYQSVDNWVLEQWAFFQGKGFYEDDNVLAQDLHAFYETFQASEKFAQYATLRGEIVRFYPLPVNGVLYREAGYTTPMVLDANRFFIVYNLTTQTGQLAPQHSPMLKVLFQPIAK